MHYRSERYMAAAVSALVVATLVSLGAILIRDVAATGTVSEIRLRGPVQYLLRERESLTGYDAGGAEGSR